MGNPNGHPTSANQGYKTCFFRDLRPLLHKNRSEIFKNQVLYPWFALVSNIKEVWSPIHRTQQPFSSKYTGWGRTKSAAANPWCLFQITHFCSSLLFRGLSWKFHSGIHNTLILNILDKSNNAYIRSYSCSMFCLLPLSIHNCWTCFMKSIFIKT